MHFRKLFIVAAVALSGAGLCSGLAAVKAKEVDRTLEPPVSLIDRIQPYGLRSAAWSLAPRETAAPRSSIAQAVGTNDAAIRQLEARGFQNISGLVRRGDNFIAQAKDPAGVKVRVVLNARTGEIVGLSRIMKKK